jgi:hypothetical protein
MAWGVTMEDGTPVLKDLELKGRALNLSVTSAERAERGVALIRELLVTWWSTTDRDRDGRTGDGGAAGG